MSGQARLAIDYGGASTVAVLAWPDGRWTPVTVDGAPAMPSAVWVAEDTSVWTGQQAWQAAVRQPHRFVPAPQRFAEQTLTVDGRQLEAADLVAATLRRVAEQAGQLTGAPLEDVRLVVPAGWGPRRRTWMRHAAHRAGLGQPRLVEAPVAVAEHLLATGAQMPVGAYLAVVDVGGGAEVTVLRRGPAGFEVLATLADPDAGGDAIDHALAAILAGGADGGGWAWAVSVRAAKETLAYHAAITVPQPTGTAVVATSMVLEQVARPILERVGQLTADAVAAAELTTADLAGIVLVGGTARLPQTATVIAELAGLAPWVVEDPALAAARGAAGASSSSTANGEHTAGQEPVPPARRALGIAVPGFASLVMITQMLLTVTRGGVYPNEWAEPSWGQLAMAAVFAVIACLCAGTLLGSLAAAHSAAPTTRSPAGTVSIGILSAVSLGAAIASLYAVIAAQYLKMPVGPFLRWALLPLAPVAVLALIAAVVAARQWRTPPGGWSALLSFPASSVLTAAVGIGLVQYSMTADRWPDMVFWIDLSGRVGGLLLGIGTVMALVRPWALRLVLGAPLAVITSAITAPRMTGTLAGIYATAVAVWWVYRLWTRLVRTPATT
ncbi:Hsp70 protein [Micromonospora matsumotoense]|uniref:Hsp70 protein n=1 Tax=Micromonospora matsumotoense TaxID=121616 RepID=A0A1C5AC14_9ACTN|nr:Hsp70 family protein [Micromonospora matsumotoense]SCF42757.1 Hsp70 protein [Micromonospora matsumotoense]